MADKRVASGWRLIALAIVFYGAADVAMALYMRNGELAPFPSIADALYLMFYPVFLAGVSRFPVLAGRLERTRLQLGLDAAIVAAGGVGMIWYLVLGPTLSVSGNSLPVMLVSTAYPIGDLALIVALSYLLMGVDWRSKRPMALLTAGVALYVVGDVIYTWLQLHSGYAAGSPVDFFWMIAAGFFVLAANVQRDGFAKPASVVSGRLIALPLASVAAVLVLMLIAERDEAFFPGLSLTILACVMTVLLTLRQVYSQRALSLANGKLTIAQAELAALASSDSATGLPNHRALIAAIDHELERAHRFNRSFSVLFLDIDHFKALNDTYGHEVGDSALRELGDLGRRTLRAMDTFGRWGGEEFVAVLPEIDEATAHAIAERLRASIAEHLFCKDTVGAHAGIHLTGSLGVADYPANGTARRELLAAADRAMYAAKRLGRNQVCLGSDPATNAVVPTHGIPSSSQEETLIGAIDALADIVSARDSGTGLHVRSVALLARELSLALDCSADQARRVYRAAKLHDIGKVAVADAILHKPGKLTEDEWALMRTHPVVGAEIVARIPTLGDLAPIIRSHHEHYDGAGYPDGIRGDDLPLEARIIAVADAFSAMTTDRPYRNARSTDAALAELRRCAGSQFDPAVVRALERLLRQGGAVAA